MKKVYGYIRVSTAKQGEGVSLIAQKEAIERYALQNHLEIIQWFEEKETAAKLGRPLFTAMMKALQAKKVDGVVIHKIDRGARNLKDWSDIGNLIDQGIEVHFAHESLDLQARGGRLSADIQAVIAADYVRNLRQEAIKGIYGRLKQGIYPFKAPTGYLDAGAGKCKRIDPIQGPLVRKTFELYATGAYTLQKLSVKMEELGLRNTLQSPVGLNALSVILNNPFYVGIIKIKGMNFDGKHEPIISPELFGKARDVLRGKTNQRTQKHTFRFRKLIRCKECQYSIVGEVQKGLIYYRCHTKKCLTTGIRETTIENHVLSTLKVIQLHPSEVSILEQLLNQYEQTRDYDKKAQLEAIKLQKRQVELKLDRLTDCYIEGGLDKETYESRKENLLLNLKAFENSESRLQTNTTSVLSMVKNFLELAKSLEKSYKNGSVEEKRSFLQITTSNLELKRKNVGITMRSPFLELKNRHLIFYGGLNRDMLRKENSKCDVSDISIPPVKQKPLTKRQLKMLFDYLIEFFKVADEESELLNILDTSEP